MIGYDKIKYILLVFIICILGGCNNMSQEPVSNGSSQGLEDTKETDSAMLEEAILLIQDKKYPQAIGLLSQIKNNKKADDLQEQIRYIISGDYIANLNTGVAAINNSGKVNIIISDDTIYEYYGYDELSSWTDIRHFSYAHSRLDALDKNGIIHSTRDTDPTYNPVVDLLKSYTDLSVISTYYDHFALLSKDGKLYIHSERYSNLLDKYGDYISTWEDVVDVITGDLRIVALNRGGRVYVADYNKYVPGAIDHMYDEIADWTNIVAISASTGGPIAGLKSDGTVVISTSDTKLFANYYSYDVSDWNDIIAISKGHSVLIGLKRDGTVVATGDIRRKKLDFSDWTDIIAIAAGDWFCIGLKSDGTLVIEGETQDDIIPPNVSDVNNLYVPTITY